MEKKTVLIIFLFYQFIYCYSQRDIWVMDTVIIIKGDSVINMNSTKFQNDKLKKENGLFYFIGSRLISQNKILLTEGFSTYKDGSLNGLDLTYIDNGNFLDFLYYKNDSLEGIQIFSLPKNYKSIFKFSVYDNNKIVTTFGMDNHFRIIFRIYFANEVPSRIIFFDKKSKIKGDYYIEETDLKNNYLKFSYWKNKK